MSLLALVDSETLQVYYYYYTSGGIPNDVNDHCVRLPVPDGVDYLCTKATKSEDGTISLVLDPDLVAAKQWIQVRFERNKLLAESDWTQLLDAPVVNKTAWTDYRTELRQLPETQTDPMNIVWPALPI